MKIEEIDKNFQSKSIGNREFLFKSVTEKPFELDGFPWRDEMPETPFHRIPVERLKGKVNDGVIWLGRNSTGGTCRFRTDSTMIALRATLEQPSDMNHMPRGGSAGFDLHMVTPTGTVQIGNCFPGPQVNELEACMIYADLPAGLEREFILTFPLYGGAFTVEIGLLPGATLTEPSPWKIDKPIVFYGSSITQGGCASRPGNCYPNLLCRALKARQVNLGFSGSGRGEEAMAELINELDPSLFVFDYDHNAPDVEYLRKTHEPFFKIIRAKHPELPVIFASKCDIWPYDPSYDNFSERREVIRTTFRNAVNAGDKHVYFVDGETLFGTEDREACCVDRCHPNDLGFYRMYKTFLPVVKRALAESGYHFD